MKTKNTLFHSAAILMVANLFWNAAYASLATAQLTTTQAELTQKADLTQLASSPSEMREKITGAIESGTFQAELQKMGVSPSEITLRLAAMSDQELMQIQQGLQRQAGGEAIVVISLTTLLIGIIILLLVAR